MAIPASKAEAEPLILLEERPERQSLSAQRAAEPKNDGKKLLSACMAAAVELEATRGLVSSLETENEALKERLETEKQATAILRELNETRKSESDSLRAVVIAKNETIAAQDKVICPRTSWSLI